MSQAAKMSLVKQTAEAKKEVENSLVDLKKALPDESVSEYEKAQKKIVLSFEHDIENPIKGKVSRNGDSSVLSSLDVLELFFEGNKKIKTEEDKKAKTEIKQIRNDVVEPILRKAQLKSDSKESFVQAIWWFSQHGDLEILDSLRQVKEKPPYESEEIRFLIEQARTKICERECIRLLPSNKKHKNLESFYHLTTDQLQQAITKMLLNEREEPFAPLPELFAPATVEKAVVQLEETKQMIRKIYKPGEIKKWLTTPNADFLDESPKDVILKGKVFRILQHFIRLGEGIS